MKNKLAKASRQNRDWEATHQPRRQLIKELQLVVKDLMQRRMEMSPRLSFSRW